MLVASWAPPSVGPVQRPRARTSGSSAAADDARPGRGRRRRQRRGHRPAVRVAHRLRPEPRPSARRSPSRGTSSTTARRIVVPPPRRPDVLRRQPARGRGRRPQLAAGHRPRRAVAARRADARRRGRRAIPARRDPDAADVGLRADGRDVEVDLVRPGDRLPDDRRRARRSRSSRRASTGTRRASTPGAASSAAAATSSTDAPRRPDASTRTSATGPARRRSRRSSLIGDLGGRSPVEAFEEGDLDYTPIGDFDASWIRLRPGRSGRRCARVAVAVDQYYGFDTREPPFDDVRVRQAFAAAVDWRGSPRWRGTATRSPATSMVPPGIPGRSDATSCRRTTRTRRASSWPTPASRAARGFPDVTFMTGGGRSTTAFVAEIERELGVDVRYETMDSTATSTASTTDPPAIWSPRWVADYPGPQRLPGRAARHRARRTTTAAGRTPDVRRGDRARPAPRPTRRGRAAAYDRAEAIVRDEVAGRPGRLRHRLGAVRDGLLGRRPERARHPAPGGARVGRVMRAGRALAAVARASLLAGRCWRPSPSGRSQRRLGRVRHADRDVDLRRAASTSASRSTIPTRRVERVELLLSFPGALGPIVVEVGPTPAAGATTLRHALDLARRPSCARTRRSRPAGGSSAADGQRRRSGRRSTRRATTTTGSTGRPLEGDIVRVHWYEGDDAFGAAGARRSARSAVRETRELLGVDRDGAGRLLHLRRPGRVLRRARAGHPRERRRPGRRRHPDAVRADPAERDRRRVGRHRRPARARRTSCSTPPSTTRTTSRRAG